MSKNYTEKIVPAFLKELKKEGMDGYVISNKEDQKYVSGFTFVADRDAVILVSSKGSFCFTRSLYVDHFSREVKHIKPVDTLGKNLYEAAAEMIKKLKLKKVGFDPAKVAYANGLILAKKCVAHSGILLKMRQVKHPGEIENIAKACQITAKTYEMIRKALKPGMTETETAGIMEAYMKKLGADGLAFSTIVCFGADGANPHHHPANVKLKKEDAVLVDFGCTYNGYCSDMTRSWWHGKKEPAEYKKIWKIVDTAKSTALKTVKAGMKAKDIDTICRDIITKAGYGETFIHSAGHCLGLEIHETPFASQAYEDKLKENMVITVEPGIYLNGKYGVRLEDTVSISKTGVKILTKK